MDIKLDKKFSINYPVNVKKNGWGENKKMYRFSRRRRVKPEWLKRATSSGGV